MNDVPISPATACGELTETPRILEELHKSRLRHYIPAQRSDLTSAMILSSLLETTSTPTSLEIEKIYFQSGYSTFSFMFRNLEERAIAVSSTLKIAERNSTLNARLRQVNSIATELTLNAIHSSKTAFEELTRQSFEFNSDQKCSLIISFDDKRLLIICTDPVGSLQGKKLLSRLRQLYGPSKVMSASNLETGQSGIGCKIIIDNCTDFFATSQRFKSTLVGCILPLGQSGRLIDTTPKCIHIVSED